MTAPLVKVRYQLADRAGEATDPRVVVGDRLLAVELAHPDHGRFVTPTYRPPDEGDIGSGTVAALAADATEPVSSLRRAAGVAAMNALWVSDLAWQTVDPMAQRAADVEAIATVGLVRPGFVKFSDVTVRIVEPDLPDPTSVETPSGIAVETYAPDGDNRAFAAGVDVVAGGHVTGWERVFGGIRTDECGTDLYDHGVEKVYVTATNRPRGVFAVGGGERNRTETERRDAKR
jgi:hypothetical protein